MEASVVVAGPPGAGKTALLDALLGAEAAEEKRGAGPAGGLRRPSLRAHPRRPDWLFWELSLPEEEEEEEEGGEGEGPGAAAARWVEGAGAAALVLLCGRRGHFGARARGLAREARAAGRSVFFVRSRADLELHTLRRLLPPPRPFDRPQALRALREVAQEEAGADAEPGGVFLVSALQPRDLDLPRLRASLQALLRAQERVQGPPDLGFEVISDREAAEIQEAYALGGLAAVADRVEGSLEALWSARVDLALVAEEGEREGAALLEDLWGVEGEPPAEPPTPHPFPGHPSVTLWELPLHDPGDVDVARFDAFLLLSSGPFGEGLLRLADEVAARGKPCFFICTEVDRDPETLQKKKAEEGEAIFCYNCTSPTGYNCSTTQQTCPSSVNSCITIARMENSGDQDFENPTYEKKCNSDDRLCNQFYALQAGNFHMRWNSSCCRFDRCNTQEVIVQRASQRPNGVRCNSCFSRGTNICPNQTRVACTGLLTHCIHFSTSANKEEFKDEQVAFMGCATKNFCDMGAVALFASSRNVAVKANLCSRVPGPVAPSGGGGLSLLAVLLSLWALWA
ncbi:immunity-related GTPase family Q protein isoform X3 [Anolis carolinensis]|uniref:immunity-related GTPase family Q protein isoform X3 n=1 Tax=Anolis carolinensis TaxID=28377 RepID=UPI002F2B665E